MGERRASERPNPMAYVTNQTEPATDDVVSGTTLSNMPKREGDDKLNMKKKSKMDTEEWSILYNELQALMNPSGDRLKAGGGGNRDVLAAGSHEKFCCCPSAQCYSCSKGRARPLHKNASANDEGPQCFWRVPNECPCFGSSPHGEVRGNRSTGGAARGQCNVSCCNPTTSQQCCYPNFRLPLPKLTLHLPTNTNCCTYDEIDKPYISYKLPFKATICRRRRRIISKGLGNPFGILQSTVTLNNNDSSQQIVRFASYLKTLALIYLQDVKSWKPTDLDQLLEEGRQHLLMVNDIDDTTPPQVTFQSESTVCKMFEFRGYKFFIELEDNVWQPLQPKQLYRELKTSLEPKYSFVLLQVQNWYILIWRTRHMYLVLDLNGRNRWTLKSDPNAYDENNAVATLFCLRNIINVVHLIINMSNLEPDEPYLIRKMMVTEFVTPEHNFILPHYRIKSDYVLVNDNYAYLRSNLHLSLNPEKSKGNQRSLPVGIAAMIATKIDHPATWDTKTLDSIICYGVYSSNEFLDICYDFNDIINRDRFSHCLRIGQFVANFGIDPLVYQGFWKCRPNSKDTDFDLLLRTALAKEDFLFFEINQQMYSIWKKNGFYYLLDPYRHFIYEPIDGNINALRHSNEKSALIHMFRSVDALINLFHDILLLSNRTSKFFIHTLEINWLELKNEEIIMRMSEEVGEVESLNEFLLFNENYDKCLEDLSQISDYEEDIVSDVSSLISLESSESYYPEEEEEEEQGGESESDYDIELNKQIQRLKQLHKKEITNLFDKSKTKIIKKHFMLEEDNFKHDIENELNNLIQRRKSSSKKLEKIKRHSNLYDKSIPKIPEKSIFDYETHFNDQFTDQLALLRNERNNYRNTNLLFEKTKTKEPDNNTKSEETTQSCRRTSGKDLTSCKKRKRVTFDTNNTNCKHPINNSRNYNYKSKKLRHEPSDVPSKLILTHARNCCYESISKILNYALKCADRILIKTDFENFVVFRNSMNVYYLYEGCTCVLDRFRYWDLNVNTVGLLRFYNLHDIICYIIDTRDLRSVGKSFHIKHNRCKYCS